MLKEEFLAELEKHLSYLSDSERNDILFDYDEHITIAAEQGIEEASVIESLGTPENIAKRYSVRRYNTVERKGRSGLKSVLAALGLTFFNLAFILGPFVAVIGILIAGAAISFAVFVSGGAMIVGGMFPQLFSGIDFHAMAVELQGNVTAALLFGGVGTMCLGGLMGMFTAVLIKLFSKISIRYLKLNVDIVRGK